MLRIGEVAKNYDISNRTLRYWEEMGIIKSSRMENGYRYFNSDNVSRINHIVLLRKLKMPIADIERIFIADDLGAAIDTLTGYLSKLKHDAAVYGYLISIIEELVQGIKSSQNLEQMFHHLETQSSAIDLRHTAPQIRLSERVIPMSKEQLTNVRIVTLPAMTIATYRAESATPEDDCSKIFNKFVLENNLHKRSGYRNFGFNNPSPSAGSPAYGYEMWVTIPEDFDVPQPLKKKQFGGGLYASISTNMNEIGERWYLLYEWCKHSEKYAVDSALPCLEECTMDFETFITEQVSDGEKQLDLLEPIKLK